jgi:hypothetical protein
MRERRPGGESKEQRPHERCLSAFFIELKDDLTTNLVNNFTTIPNSQFYSPSGE